MGLGHFGGGASAARWLARQGAVVTVTDLADEETLADSLATLADEPIARFHLGGHREDDFRHAELVVVNPAVRPGDRFLQIAREFGVPISSEIELFLEACPAPIVGVTGSNGKSTTAAMTAAIFRADGRQTWLGGNIGHSLLDDLDEMTPDDRVVLEISSFQLWRLGRDAPMPRVVVVTGCTANHLDWHGSFENYAATKKSMLKGQKPDDLAVLNTYDAEVALWGRLVQGTQLPLVSLDQIPPLAVPGEHNRINAACAATAARGMGCSEAAVRQALMSFHGLPQRLQQIAVIDGRTFYNDSTSTTPESTIAALKSLDEQIWLLAGGHDKGGDFRSLIDAVARHARGAAFFGAAGERLQRRVDAGSPGFPATMTDTMAEALRWCWARSRPGDAIVLSPACASSDQFRNFRQRGKEFEELVRTALAAQPPQTADDTGRKPPSPHRGPKRS